MWSTKEYLKACEQLKGLGLDLPFAAGMRIARGFADLGIEEFLLLPGDKLLSLCSGSTSQLPNEHRKFFFLVPSFEQLVNAIQELDFDLLGVEFKEQREWQVKLLDIRASDGVLHLFTNQQILLALMQALISCLALRQ